MKSRVGSVLLGALVSVLLGSGVARSQPGKAWEPLARTVLDGSAYDSVLLRADGTVWVWGSPYSYLQGPAPAPMAGLTDVVAISSGGEHGLALRADGTVSAWGSNWNGELGDGTYEWRVTAAPVLDLTDVVSIAAGFGYSLALRADGTVWAWGSNWSGQLGVGVPLDWNDYQKNRPVRVPGLVDVVAISAGEEHSLALRADGTVWAWGNNWFGQLGGATAHENSFLPVQVPGLSDVKRIDAGRAYNLVVRADGTLWAWGRNWSGQLGDGTMTDRPMPMQVPGLPEVAAAAGGDGHALALAKDGTVWAWGGNHFGALGDGTRIHRLTPAPVPQLDKVVALAAGHSHSLAVRKDGSVWGWGHNLFGSVGDGTASSEPRLTPARAVLPCRSVGLPALDNRHLEPRECHAAP
ncbi:RCC1 domain-containing protein [Archangium gephyra]|uniref:RCC1 domain-containing protein n=1 Tax=Archangium gephyra TaxID=48 RepID=UPI003B7F7857